MSKVVVHRQVLRYLQRIPKSKRERVKTALQQLAEDMNAYPGIVHMVGEWAGYHRIRIGGLRVIFWYDEREDIIYIDHIGPRGDVYKH